MSWRIGQDVEWDGRWHDASGEMRHGAPCCVCQAQAWEAPVERTASGAGMGAGCALGAGLSVRPMRAREQRATGESTKCRLMKLQCPQESHPHYS